MWNAPYVTALRQSPFLKITSANGPMGNVCSVGSFFEALTVYFLQRPRKNVMRPIITLLKIRDT
jgi:hypothetical protein